ncbi:hypothetical protein [Streptomyces sp. NPDC050548]|uniref:hypothetical protein n=1 Tax=Streptomyces sp. NPDC050548 TaxID=3365629 RepID=UPI0037B71D19
MNLVLSTLTGLLALLALFLLLKPDAEPPPSPPDELPTPVIPFTTTGVGGPCRPGAPLNRRPVPP